MENEDWLRGAPHPPPDDSAVERVVAVKISECAFHVTDTLVTFKRFIKSSLH